MSKNQNSASQKPRISRHLKIVLTVLAVVVIGLAVAAEYALHHVEPIMRDRVVESLSNRFKSQVELGEFHVTFTQE